MTRGRAIRRRKPAERTPSARAAAARGRSRRTAAQRTSGAQREPDPAALMEPAYVRAKDTLLRMIEGPDYGAGDKIPSERTLSDMLGISRMTVRRSVDDLVRLGVLERRSTSGTHVAAPSIVRPLDPARAMSVSRIIESSGGKAGGRLLYFEMALANRHVARHLKVRTGAPLVAIRRLRTIDKLPFCVETSYLPAERVPGLAAADLMGDASLFALLEQRFGIRLGRRTGTLSVAPIVSEDAKLLGMLAGVNVLVYRIDVYDDKDQPIEHMVSINHPQRVTFATSSVHFETEDVVRGKR